MTIIHNLGDTFYIESVSTAHNSVVTTSGTNVDVLFEKPGTIMGLSYVISCSALVSGWAAFVTLHGGNSRITSLPQINQIGIRTRIQNDSGVTLSINIHILALMRRPGR